MHPSARKGNSPKFKPMILHISLLWDFKRLPSPGRIPNPKGYIL